MEKITEIIKNISPLSDIDASTRLIEDHVLDSLSMILLVSELEDEFDIEISAREIVPENFQSVEAIARLMERLQNEE